MSVNLLIGRKEGMTQLFDEKGDVVPVTVVRAGPCPVVQVKTPETDGYSAVQLGFGPRREKRVRKPILGHLKKAGQGGLSVLREAACDGDVPKAGDTVRVGDVFHAGDWVDVIGTTKGAVSRLETVTGRRCALATFASPIIALAVDGRFLTVATAAGTTQLLARSLKPPKPLRTRTRIRPSR